MWKGAHAAIVSEPEDKPWKLREFMAADLDGNLIREHMHARIVSFQHGVIDDQSKLQPTVCPHE